jgi:subtilisin family serine protease
VDAGEDERGREVRARLLSLATVGLVLAPAAHAQAPQTGRLLVTVAPGTTPRARVTAAALAATAGARPAGFSVPQLHLVTLRSRGRLGLHALAVRLRADPRVARVEVEHRARPRLEPNDPALVTPETAIGTAPSTPIEWWAARSNFPAAWDVSTGAGATVAVIDTGAETSHPELADRVLGAASFDADGSAATTDSVGHGTHVASLACGAGNNGVGLAGAGLRCRMLILKSDFSDSSVAKAIVYAVDHGADAINMSFGTDPGIQPSQAVRDAVDYAFAHNVVMAAAAADTPIADQGYPADLLQPTGTGPDLAVDEGLSVTAADASDARASFAGQGSQISLAAYGAYDSSPAAAGPPGIFGAFTAAPNELETGSLGLPPHPPCTCRTTFAGDSRYAYVQGTSMATPMVAATGALIRHLNPDLTAAEIVRLIKETARRPAGGWTADLGWGILDAGAALTRAAGIDRRAPASRVKPLPAFTRKPTITVRWSAADKAAAGVRASGLARFELWRATDGGRFKRLFSTTRTSRQVTLRRGGRYRFYTVAIDHAGNREPAPKQADARVQRRRR